jgi:hypothetical protein
MGEIIGIFHYNHPMKLLTLATALLFLALPVRADEEGDDKAVAVAQRYGLESDKIGALKFTCHVRVGTTTTTRTWSRDNSSGEIILVRKEGRKSVTKTFRPSGASNSDPNVLVMYRKDHAWLLFPRELMNDRGMEIILDENESFPIPVEPGDSEPYRGDRLTLDYVGGKNDINARVIQLFLDHDNRIQQWTLRTSWKDSKPASFTWDEEAALGPIFVSLRRRSADGEQEIWFSDVEAKLRDSNDWLKAEPAGR